MLQSIRERAQGVIAWFIVVLISVPFALWGIQSYLGVGTEPVMATVNGEEITEREFEDAYRNFRQNLREQLGQNYNPDLIDESVLRKQVLDSMIDNRLIAMAAADLGLRAGDEHVRGVIRSNPAFQVAGQFNQQTYEQAVRRIGLNTVGYEAQRRAGLISEQIPKAVVGSEFATQSEINELVRLRQQKRKVEYLVLPSDRFNDTVTVTDDEMKVHFDANQANYMAPERVKLEYLDLEASTIAKTLTADDETLKGYYDQNKTQYQTAEERRASHILFSLEEGTEEEIIRAKAEGVLKRAQAGEDFAALAKEFSEDPGSADMGGDLDYFERGVMAQAFEDAAFKLNEGEVSDLVKSEFGFHIIKVTAIRASQGKSFEEAKEDVRASYLTSEAERKYYEFAERLSELAYEDPNSLNPAAEALGLQVQTSDWVTRNGSSGVLGNQKVINAAFSQDVLIDGLNSEAIELAQDHMIVVRVVDHENAAPQPFDTVKEQIKTQLIAQKSASQATDKAASVVQDLRSGKGLMDVAAEFGQVAVQKVTLNRDSKDVDSELLRKVYLLPHPSSGKASVDSISLSDGSVAIVMLTEVIDGSPDLVNELGGSAALTDALRRSRGRSYFESLQRNLRSKAEIIITNRDES